MNNVCEEEKMCEINAFFSKIVLLFFFNWASKVFSFQALGLKSFSLYGLGPQKFFLFRPWALKVFPFLALGLKSFFFSGSGPQKYFPFGPKA